MSSFKKIHFAKLNEDAGGIKSGSESLNNSKVNDSSVKLP